MTRGRQPSTNGLFALMALTLVGLSACSGTPQGGGSSSGSSGVSSSGGAADAQAGDAAGDAAVDPACGRLTTPCPPGGKCEGAQDCADKNCRNGTCQAAAPADGVKNGDETDIDCGGSKAPACADGKACGVASDCTSGVCTGGVCQVPTATDGVKNGDETGKDCGGSKAPKCKTGEGCAANSDCDNVLCDMALKKCAGPTYNDGIKNGDETGIDCGGPNAPNRCPTGQGCVANADCNNVLCDVGGSNLCKAPAYDDGLKNGDETGTDCGGPNAPNRCPTGQGCAANADCNNVLCNMATKVCNPPAYNDGLRNGDETGTDCGGPNAPARCPVGQGCVANSDCNNVACDTGVTDLCLPPSAVDNIKNGTETDVDCGGGAPTNAPKCSAGKVCTGNNDCASAGCAYNNRCAPARSCVMRNGGDTCGRGEVGQAGASHESCCATQTTPGGVVLDKYEITAGRMREFIRATGNNVAGWVQANRAITQQISDQMVDYLPSGLTTPSRTIMRCDGAGNNCSMQTIGFGVYDHLGNTVFMPDRPCPNCGQGCWIGSVAQGGYGHPTYWWDAATQGRWGAQPRSFSQAEMDVKSLNCVTQVMLAAFCAWDGGRLATTQELGTDAWGPAAFPWGGETFRDAVGGAAAPGRVAYPYSATNFLVPMVNTNGSSNYANAVEYNYTNWNPFTPYMAFFRYAWPIIPTNRWDQTDQAYAIAAPGRMYKDFRFMGPNPDDGFHDIAGNIMEVGGNYTGALDDANHNGWPRANWTGGSFEGHGVARSGYNLNVLTKYGKMGGRCARSL